MNTQQFTTFLKDSIFSSFNNVGETAEETANKYFSHDLQFHVGNTGKVIDFDAMVERIETIRDKMKHVAVIVTDVNIADIDATFASGTHYIISENKNGQVNTYKTVNIYTLKDGKIQTIRGVESILDDGSGDAAAHQYSTK